MAPGRRAELDAAVAARLGDLVEVETAEEFQYLQARVCDGGNLLLADWGATWCAPCRKMAPQLSALAKAHAKEGLVVVKLDLDKLQAFSGACGISAVPTFVAYGKGEGGAKELLRVVGANPGELEQKMAALVSTVSAASVAKTEAERGGGDGESLVKCELDDEYRPAVLSAVRAFRTREGGEWAVSACRSLGKSGNGNFSLGLVVCSGDMCRMVNAVVTKDGQVLSV